MAVTVLTPNLLVLVSIRAIMMGMYIYVPTGKGTYDQYEVLVNVATDQGTHLVSWMREDGVVEDQYVPSSTQFLVPTGTLAIKR